MITDTLYLIYPDGRGHYEPQPVNLDEHPEGTKAYLSEDNARNHPELNLAELTQ